MKHIETNQAFLICLCRFLYPIYTLICVAAAAVIDTFPDFFHDKYSSDQSIFEKVSLVNSMAFMLSCLLTGNGCKVVS